MVSEGETGGIYFIGEIGINHNGDLAIAKRLLDAVFGLPVGLCEIPEADA